MAKDTGYNAMEYDALRKLTKEDYRKLNADLEAQDGNGYMGIFSSPVHLAICVIALLGTIFLKGWLHTGSIVLLAISGLSLFKRASFKEGYLHGYQDGFECGIDRALGITEKDKEFIEEVVLDNAISESMEKAQSAKSAPLNKSTK